MYLGGAGMKAQMKYADAGGAPAVIIQGSNEKDAGEVQIKDLVEGARYRRRHRRQMRNTAPPAGPSSR